MTGVARSPRHLPIFGSVTISVKRDCQFLSPHPDVVVTRPEGVRTGNRRGQLEVARGNCRVRGSWFAVRGSLAARGFVVRGGPCGFGVFRFRGMPAPSRPVKS